MLKPKLRAPAPRDGQLARPRLLRLFEDAPGRKITLISAPAGYGKTTLLTQWYGAERGRCCAWVSLDGQDNDPVMLWMDVVEALRQAAGKEDFGTDVLLTMSAARQGLIPITLPMLVNDLAELPFRMAVVLDDYHHVTDEHCHDSMAFFVEHLPENLHLVLSTRSNPPLPLARLRARGEMNEIRAQQLAFTAGEADLLLNGTMQLGIGPVDLSILQERTEGWPAALYLAALSLRAREDKQAFIHTFGGSDRYVVELLGEEVLANLPAEVGHFLLRSSVLEKMTGLLCDAVVGREDSGRLLRKLAGSNLVAISSDEQGEWYRYHHLFSDFLLHELKNSRPELVPELHRRASEWLEGAGLREGAIYHAIEAADHGRAGTLVARYWYRYVVAGKTATVERWLAALPEELTCSNAALLLVKAWICTLSGRRGEAEGLLSLAEAAGYEGPLPDGTVSVEAGAATLRAVFGLGGVRSTLEAARRAWPLQHERPSPWPELIEFGLGCCSYLSGENPSARMHFERALGLAGSDQPLLRMSILSFLAVVATDGGRLEAAESLARQARATVDRCGLQGIPQSSLVHIALGRLLAKRGDLDDAQAEIERGLTARRQLSGMSPWPALIGLVTLAPVRAARGDREGALGALSEARTTVEGSSDAGIFPPLLDHLERTIRTRPRRQSPPNGLLTARELDVLGLLEGELSAREIAQSLYVAPSTVRSHIKSIYRKLGVSSRYEAVEEARAIGLL